MDPTNFPARDKEYLHLSTDKGKLIVEKMTLFKKNKWSQVFEMIKPEIPLSFIVCIFIKCTHT